MSGSESGTHLNGEPCPYPDGCTDCHLAAEWEANARRQELLTKPDFAADMAALTELLETDGADLH